MSTGFKHEEIVSLPVLGISTLWHYQRGYVVNEALSFKEIAIVVRLKRKFLRKTYLLNWVRQCSLKYLQMKAEESSLQISPHAVWCLITYGAYFFECSMSCSVKLDHDWLAFLADNICIEENMMSVKTCVGDGARLMWICNWLSSCVCRGSCVCPVFTQTGPLPLLRLASNAKFSGASLLHTRTTQFNSNRTSVVRSGRQKYERLYPVMLIQTDGSTVNIRYKEPKRMLMVSAPSPSILVSYS